LELVDAAAAAAAVGMDDIVTDGGAEFRKDGGG
jgi:hypothetical protein